MTYVYIDDLTSKEKFYATDIAQEPQQMLLGINEEYLTSNISLEDAVKPLIEFIPNIIEKVTLAKDNCKNPSDDLSCDESAAIYLLSMRWEPYEQCLYFALNKTLRDQNYSQLNYWKLYLKLLINGLNRLPSTRITFHQDLEHDRTRRFRKNNFLVFWDLTLCSLSIPLSHKSKQTRFYTKTRTIFSFECRNAKFIERHSSDPTRNEFLLLPTQFQFVRYLDRRNDLEIIQVKEYQTSSPLIDFCAKTMNQHRPSNQTQEISPTIDTVKIDSNSYSNCRLQRLIAAHQTHSDMNLTYQNLTVNDMFIIIKHAIIEKQCTRLFLDNNYISPECMSILVTGLSESKTLRELYFRETRLRDSSIQILAQALALNNCSIQSLNLNRNFITDQGAQYLAEMLKTNTNLRHLNLYENKISRQGVSLLVTVTMNENKICLKLDIDSYRPKMRSRLRTVLTSFSCIDN